MASPSSPTQKQRIHLPQEQQEQQQRFLQENQLQKEQLQRLFKNEDARPKKPRAYSSPAPAPYLSGQVSNTPKGEGLVNGVLPAGEGQSSRRKDKVKKSLTLSDMKAPISSGANNNNKNMWYSMSILNSFLYSNLSIMLCVIWHHFKWLLSLTLEV